MPGPGRIPNGVEPSSSKDMTMKSKLERKDDDKKSPTAGTSKDEEDRFGVRWLIKMQTKLLSSEDEYRKLKNQFIICGACYTLYEGIHLLNDHTKMAHEFALMSDMQEKQFLRLGSRGSKHVVEVLEGAENLTDEQHSFLKNYTNMPRATRN